MFIDPLREGVRKLLTEFDQNTIANMTAALEYICNKIPPDKDGHEIRKRIADAIMACGHAGRRRLKKGLVPLLRAPALRPIADAEFPSNKNHGRKS